MRHYPPFIEGVLPGETQDSSERATQMLDDIFDGPEGRDFILGKGNSNEGIARSGMELCARAVSAALLLTISRLTGHDPDQIINGPTYEAAASEVSEAIRQESGIYQPEGGK